MFKRFLNDTPQKTFTIGVKCKKVKMKHETLGQSLAVIERKFPRV